MLILLGCGSAALGDCAQHMRLSALVQAGPLQLGHETKVEEHDASLAGHQHIGRLDISVEFTRLVQGHDPLGELEQGVPKPVQLR